MSATERYHFNYHPNHQGGAGLKTSGPVQMENLDLVASATAFPTCAVSFRTAADDVEHHFIGYSDGSVYEDSALGATAPWNASASADQVSTRRMYLAGLGGEWLLNQVYLHGVWPSAAPALTVLGTRTGVPEATLGAATYTATGDDVRLDRGWAKTQVEGARLRLSGGEQAWRLDSLVLEGEDFGGEDSGT